jgi:hypothetical protein
MCGGGYGQMKPRLRDKRGRFTKAVKPPPDLLDPETLKSLGSHRRAVELTAEQQWHLTILDEKAWREWLKGKRPVNHEPKSEATQADKTSS